MKKLLLISAILITTTLTGQINQLSPKEQKKVAKAEKLYNNWEFYKAVKKLRTVYDSQKENHDLWSMMFKYEYTLMEYYQKRQKDMLDSPGPLLDVMTKEEMEELGASKQESDYWNFSNLLREIPKDKTLTTEECKKLDYLISLSSSESTSQEGTYAELYGNVPEETKALKCK
ncbi:MAG: hypothetical protein AAGC47_07640 [Bacteroidota bacterium]